MSRPTLTGRLLEEVVIFDEPTGARTGAQAILPDETKAMAAPGPGMPLPIRGTSASPELQQAVEQFLFHQAELLDAKQWSAYIDLFTEDGVYWMPAEPAQTEWLDSPSIFAEDRMMMRVREGRVTHRNAWSQAPAWGTSHVVGSVVIESASESQLQVRSRFHMIELRRDTLRHFAGAYRHTLVRAGKDFRIQLQRVDLLNAQSIFDYVLQVWV